MIRLLLALALALVPLSAQALEPKKPSQLVTLVPSNTCENGEGFVYGNRVNPDGTFSSFTIPPKQVLVVTRLGETGTVCHVAYVDALLNPNANALAREAADTIARIFTCSHDEPGWIGNTRQPAM